MVVYHLGADHPDHPHRKPTILFRPRHQPASPTTPKASTSPVEQESGKDTQLENPEGT